MWKTKKSVGGKIAKTQGEMFENLFRSSAAVQKLKTIKIPDGSKIVRTPKGLKTIRIKSPFDFILLGKNQVAFIDTKSTNNATFPKSKITSHQMYELLECEKLGHIAGYVIYFRKTRCVTFIKASQLLDLKKGQSLNHETGINLGNPYNMQIKKIFDNISPPPAWLQTS